MHEAEQIQELRQALEEERKARQEFVSLVTHELRVPMTSIKGYTDLLLKGIMGPVNEAQTNFLSTIRSNVERMSRMVSDLSDINKLEADALKLTPTEVALDDALEEALHAHEAQIAAKGHTVTQDLPEALPPLWCDRGRLVQVLGNLIGNAVQYTPEGGHIAITAEERDDDVRVTVQDDGIGIPAEEQDRIFEPFFRASDEETRATPGNGLALYVSKLLVERQHGNIGFESERGAGSTFYIELPNA